MKSNKLGIGIAAVSLMVIGLLFFYQFQLDQQNLQTCEGMCGDAGSSCSLDACPFHQGRSLTWIPIFASILIAAVGGVGVFLAFSKPEKIIEKKEYDLTGLDQEEKQLFHIVKDSDAGIYQSEIVTQTELTKVKVTRILDALEKRGLIERRRRGMTNIVVLK